MNKGLRSTIAIFGGTFNPPHKAHVVIARKAVKQFKLDKVIFIPAHIPPHKPCDLSVNSNHRLEMLKLAIGKSRCFEVSTIELNRRGVSYTIDTLKYFRKKYPKAKLFLIIGADNLAIFRKWKHYKSILKIATILVYKRKRYSKTLKQGKINYLLIKGGILDISSSRIRVLVKKSRSFSGLVPKAVAKYIKEHSLYKI